MISIIVPAYNLEKYIRRCIESIVHQTYNDYEIIIIDDGSTDRTAEICDQLAKKYAVISVIHTINHGAAAARNIGLEVAKGQYISFVDGDDVVHPKMLEIMYGAIIKEQADIAVCSFENVYEGDMLQFEEISHYSIERMTKTQALIRRWDIYVMPWNKLYKRKIFETIRFPQGKLVEDEFVFHKIIFEAEKIIKINLKLYFYFNWSGNTMNGFRSDRILCAMEALESRLDFCKLKAWDEVEVAIINSIFEYATSQYLLLSQIKPDGWKVLSRQLWRWAKQNFRKCKKTKLPISYKIYDFNPLLFKIVKLYMK